MMATLELWRQNLTKKKGRTCACVNVIIHSRVDKEPSKVLIAYGTDWIDS